MDIDFKTIFIVMLIICVIAAVIYLGIRIMTQDSLYIEEQEVTATNNDVTADSESNTVLSKSSENIIFNNTADDTNNISNTYNETDTNNETEPNNETSLTISDGKLSQIYGTGLNVNNSNPKVDFKSNEYGKLNFLQDGNTRVSYYVPIDWERNAKEVTDPITNSKIECKSSRISTFIEEKYNETTYEEVLNAFAEKEKQNALDPDNVEFYTREITVNDNIYTILIKKDINSYTSYIIFIRGLYEYHLEFYTPADEYDNLLEKIDNVFSSYKII